MIRELADVIEVENHRIRVRTQSKTTCNSCQAQQNCGSGMVAKALAGQVHEFWLDYNADEIHVGDQVWLGVPEESLLTASWWVYIVPLLSMIVSVSSLSWLFPSASEFIQIIVGLTVLISTFALVRKRFADSGKLSVYTPKILGLNTKDSF